MQQVTLHLTSKQMMDGQTEESRHEYQAKAVLKQDAWFFSFKEAEEGVGEVSTILKAGEQEITLLRQGPVQMKQSFQKGQSSTSRYISPYGAYLMQVHTHKIKIEREEGRPKTISIAYQLWLNDQYAGEILLEYTMVWR